MRKIIVLLSIVLALSTAVSAAAEKKTEPNQLFYTANHDYEKKEYIKSVEGYVAILEMGLESGNLYYNIGNGFLKLGKLGHAILCYEKAKRLIPHDSDLKANLAYARSLIDSPAVEAGGNIVTRVIDRIFEDYNLREIIFSATILYLLLLAFIGLSILRPFAARRFRIVQVVIIALFTINLTGVMLRYYDERILKHGIVITKQVECKYEPIDKSTTYYTLREGGDVLILNTRDGWRQIRRPDGKIGWLKKEAVEEI